jgi:hypothetical protein
LYSVLKDEGNGRGRKKKEEHTSAGKREGTDRVIKQDTMKETE